MPNDELRDARARFVRYLDSRLVGPVDGEDEEFAGTPLLRYMMGMLFPTAGEEVELVDDGTGDDDQSADEDADDPAASASHRPLPSSLGLSFLVGSGATLECEICAAMYDQKQGGSKGGRGSKQWKRRPLPKATVSIDLAVRNEPRLVLGDKAQLHVNARPWANGGHLVTVSLVNAVDAGGKAMDPAKALFQVGLSISASGGFLPYPRAKSAAASSEDEAEVRYLYRNSPIYARGHGVAAIWDVGTKGDCRRVRASFMPTAEVRAATFEIQAGTSLDPRYRNVEFLAFNEDVLELQKVLSGVGHAFGDWLENEEKLAGQSGDAVGLELVARCKQWQERIDQGITLLADPVAHEAFVMANRAMYWQMLMARDARDGPFPASARKGVPALSRGHEFQWRPFQIAFFLGVLPSLLEGVDPSLVGIADKRNDRDVVDVIWFPTGGGKTEAYLLVAAFELIRRRLVHGGSDQAAAVLSRYTLRMLTAQQFQRTGMLVSALELLRREDPKRYGTRPFSVGLWVGQSLTPNKFGKALEAHEKWVASPSTEKNPFLLDRCPACGTSIVDDAREIVGVRCSESTFAFHCLSPECEFQTEIPMQVVDEALYKEPPSILLGTLDKFANLTWDERPKSFFSGPGVGSSPPPSLVIQDELHLISGPLGSISAPYEVAIDSIIRSRNKGHGAKVIASTATIRNSREQVRGIYGRESTVFPSPVRNWDDAFFFRLEDTATTPGRLYVGAMGQGTTTPVVSMVWTSAALLQASNEVALPQPLNDAYWTVLAYLNSRRELGRTITAASQEIPDRMKAIAGASDNVRGVSQIMELSSQMASDMGDAIRTLQRKGTEARRAVDFVPCTNIISVGVDVDRLGLMLVNGQPKLTSEYIQASSRVGRSRFAPGLVVTLYSPAKPRDRSHYEDFRAYHDSFYRFVEPTSVTPYAPPARKRTLHSAIIAMVRHATPWGANDKAGFVRFDDPVVKELLDNFKARISAADRTEAGEVADEIDHIVDAWIEQSQAGSNLRYVITSRQFVGVENALIRDYGEPMKMGMYEAMRSVRSVDPDVMLRPVGRGD